MSAKSHFIKVAALGFLALGTASCFDSTPANTSSSNDGMTKCYGIAKKGKNACSDALGKHGCAGQATKNYDPCEWKVVKKSQCKSEGGTEKPVNCKR